jgi:polyferredoxin
MPKLRVPTRFIRIASQLGFFSLWVFLIWSTRHPIDSAIQEVLPVSFFLRIDPLVFTVVSGGLRMGITVLLLGTVTLGISLILGRVFCGWVCPLGSLFDFQGWIQRRMKLKFEGPSPSYFRFKYYFLAALLTFALLGVGQPLIGFDPIVLLTRSVASVLAPPLRVSEFSLSSFSSLRSHANLIDTATLILFLSILGGTTRLSRIWCRVACPLGAYLATLSRFSLLRRKTQDCVRCGICVKHCPTGAILSSEPEKYTESECIKCFSCSDDCPVDANFFQLQNPLASYTMQHALPVELERRSFVGALGVALTASPTLTLSSGDPSTQKTLIRPPHSREEGEFLSACIRCGECMKACPTGTLKPAGLEHGLRALWTPVLSPQIAACDPSCNACSVACPTTAIQPYALDDKFKVKSGTAVFQSSLCIAHTENKYCNECVRACPTQAIAVQDGWKPDTQVDQGADVPAPDGLLSRRPTHVSFERCIGCGACETACNTIVLASPAMKTTSAGRGVTTQLDQTPS